MLSPEVARSVIDYALSLGADFAELFVERQLRSTLTTLSEKVDSVQSGVEFGIGLRMVFAGKVLYGYTNKPHADELKRIANELAVKDRRDPKVVATAFDFRQVEALHSGLKPLSADAMIDAKIEFLLAASRAAQRAGAQITQTKGTQLQREQHIALFNSEGLHVEDTRHYVRAVMVAIASDGSAQAHGQKDMGGLQGWELADAVDAAALGAEAGRQALVNLSARPCPGGEMPVVMGNGFGGVIFHEACGHLLETTSVAKKASVFHDQMGAQIAHTKVSAVDDGTLKNAWGSINIDDEGMATQRTQLIKNGQLTSFLVDRLGSEKTGYARTGSGRRESYKYAPASRMRNTFIEAGDDRFEDMIASIDRGIYASHLGGGSVKPGTGEFNFAVQEGYYVENGKILYPVKGATLISTGPKVLKEISMVSDNLELACGMCGSVSGAIPTTVGQPAIKVDRILVGGNA
ncbi:TldD/PmbA family protein [Reinekea sp. G2M2-21]|uniref:TldD/PmbA family protein n=1 Tax=Reinekea sp. G2M2-21 TaxID=2788942 RepID=UPI0018AB82C6|nr:TldD/PmbA family protein [Reinekea sp. G2M2-21]